MEFCAREVGGDIFILAAKREGDTAKVKFTGLPKTDSTADVMFEEPRKVEIKEAAFEDWFAANDVHVYQMRRGR